MDYSFNSVELIPDLRASAAFTVDSSEVFREQEDITPVTIDEHTKYRPWGAANAFLAAVPSLDLVLTPNGFGIVSNQNIAPASKERVDRLLASLESERDQAIDLLLPRLPLLTDWQQSAQGQYFAATLFPNLSLCRRLAIKQHLWAEYQAQHDRLIKIENTLAETYFSQEQMSVFRDKSLHLLTNCHPLEVQVIRSLQSLELEILTADHINSSPLGG